MTDSRRYEPDAHTVIGVIAGLYEAGLDVTEADLVIGTSAGATAAAQITSATPAALLAAILDAAPQTRSAPVGSNGGRVGAGSVAEHMERTSRIIAAAADAADLRRRMGAAALDMPAASDGSSQRWRATVAARLPSQFWPQRRVLITAVDARTGDPVVFDRESGVDLADAVAASCASGFGPRDRRRSLTSTAATDPTPRTPIWLPDTHGCWCCHPSAAGSGLRRTGAPIWRHRSPTFAHAAAESRRSSRTAAHSPRSATT